MNDIEEDKKSKKTKTKNNSKQLFPLENERVCSVGDLTFRQQFQKSTRSVLSLFFEQLRLYFLGPFRILLVHGTIYTYFIC